jgi:hypothetical protein
MIDQEDRDHQEAEGINRQSWQKGIQDQRDLAASK